MHPRQIHFVCDFCLFVPLLGIFLSIFFSPSSLVEDIYIVKDLFNSWNNKPIHILQDSYHKSCKEMGMTDIIQYNHPGNDKGCICDNKYTPEGKCKPDCSPIHPNGPSVLSKWKEHMLCAISIKPKSYFELTRIKSNDICSFKTKKCGVIDTLGNYLCIPENENCPLNFINFLPTEDQNVRIDTNNRNTEGKIFTNFRVEEGKVCVNPKQRNFYEAKFNLNEISNLQGCITEARENDTVVTYDPSYKQIDSYTKKLFYEQNGLRIPFPLDEKVNVTLYGSEYKGWKRECEKKEFNLYMNSNTDEEIEEIFKVDEEKKISLFFYGGGMTLTFILGIILIKYGMLLTNSYKVEFTSTTLTILCFIYMVIAICNFFLAIIADKCLDVIKTARISNDFFELVSNQDCSDKSTNVVLRHVANQFFIYSNRYFNIKILSILSFLSCITIILYSIFTKAANDRKTARKQKQFSYFKLD